LTIIEKRKDSGVKKRHFYVLKLHVPWLYPDQIADLHYCFTEADVRALDGSDRSW